MVVTIPEFFVTSLPVPLVVGTAIKGKGWFSRGSANDKVIVVWVIVVKVV